jgi:hypothetical protein
MTAKKGKARPRQAAKVAVNLPGNGSNAKRHGHRLIAYWPRLLFLIPMVAVLCVPFYNRIEPSLGGVPFFYWYQLALVLVGAATVLAVYLLETRVTKVTPRASASVDPGATGDVL